MKSIGMCPSSQNWGADMDDAKKIMKKLVAAVTCVHNNSVQ